MTLRELDEYVEGAINILNRLDDEPLVNFNTDELSQMFGFMHVPAIFTNYWISMLKGNQNRTESWRNKTWTDTSGVERHVFSNLFHANSVRTALDYIDKKMLYSRKYGDDNANNTNQTVQHSDELDRQLSIYNDIFFDNSDIPYRARTYTSAYGPIMFVFDIEILRNRDVRITKVNPANIRNRVSEVKYSDIFYNSIDDLKQINRDEGLKNFIMDFKHHTTVFNTGELPFDSYLKAIYIEKHYDNNGQENSVAAMLRNKLDNNGLNNVEIAIRPQLPSEYNGFANDREELWRF